GSAVRALRNQTANTLFLTGDGYVRFRCAGPLYDVVSAKSKAVGQKQWFTTLAWSSDGKRLLARSSAYGTASYGKVWDLDTGRETLLFLQAEGYDVGQAVWSPDGRHLAAIWKHWRTQPGDRSPAEYIKVWDAATGQEAARLKMPDPSALQKFAW